MAHFAKLDNQNIVTDVVTVNNVVLIDETGQENEALGIEFLAGIYNWANWKQTSYNNKFRKHYAGINFAYEATLDAFIPPKPYPSWLLNTETCLWQPPIPMPDDGKRYMWDEEDQKWVLIPDPELK
jgi:hypothetical protein